MWTLVSDGEQAATSFPSGDQQTDVAGPCSPSNLSIRFSSSKQQSTPNTHTPDDTGGGGPGNNTGRVNSPKKDPRGAANSKLRGSKRLPGEASYSFHAGKLEQWLCGAPLTGDHFHGVVVITNGKFVGVWMPR